MKAGILISVILTLLVLQAESTKKRWKYGCVLPPEPIFGRFEYNDRRKEITYICDDGYILDVREDTRKCKWNRKWTNKDGDCFLPYHATRRCRTPETPRHGSMDLLKKGWDVAYFSCDQGYELVGAKKLTCRNGKTWTGGSFPTCRSRKTVEDFANILKEDFINPLAAATADSADSKVQGKLSVGKRGLELIFLVDVSASIANESLETAKQFLKIIVAQFNVSADPSGGKNGTRVALITFSSNATVEFNLNDPDLRSIEAVNDKIDSIKSAGGGTNLKEAFVEAKLITIKVINDKSSEAAKSRRAESSKAIFIVTDAEATFETNNEALDRFILENTARQLREEYEIFAIGIGSNINKQLLTKIASHPKSEHVFLTDEFEDLDRVRDIIAEKNIDYGQCGVSGRITIQQGSHKAKKGAWPWIGWVSVMMLKNETTGSPGQSWTCGGVLLCDRWFLTMAHCVSYLATINETTRPHPAVPKLINVNLGDHDLYKEDDTQIIVPVEDILLHPNYTGKVIEGQVREYDVALLDLGEYSPLQLNKFIRPLCFPTRVKKEDDESNVQQVSEVMLMSRLRSEDKSFVAGWGHSPWNVNHTLFPWEFLYQDKRGILPFKRCKRRFPDLDENQFFCVFNPFGESDKCRGDVGGPIMDTMADDRFTVLGLAARTFDCDKGDTSFSIFQNVITPIISDWVGEHLDGCNRVKEDPQWTAKMEKKKEEIKRREEERKAELKRLKQKWKKAEAERLRQKNEEKKRNKLKKKKNAKKNGQGNKKRNKKWKKGKKQGKGKQNKNAEPKGNVKQKGNGNQQGHAKQQGNRKQQKKDQPNLNRKQLKNGKKRRNS